MKLNPYTLRDISRGIYRKASVSEALVPENSVSHSVNINYDDIVGKGKVRLGTTKLGATVASGKTPLGLTELVTSGGSTNSLIGIFSGASNADIYYYNGSWNTASTTVVLNNSAINRFASLGNRTYRVNGTDQMTSSSDGVNWGTTNCIGLTDIPSLIFRAKSRFLVAGVPGFRDRIYFSGVIDPNNTPQITWNTNNATGDWIDVNPDDGSNITGFDETSGFVLVFKKNGMYRLSVIAKTVDMDNVFPIGAQSQEGIVNCQGVVYFFSGYDIRRTVGDFPEQISRLGVQDWIDAIPQANWSSVAAATDGISVYFFIGNVTLNSNQDNQRTFNNVVLKFSPKDQNWSIHSYADTFKFFAQYTTSANGRKMVGQDTSGDVQTINLGTTDNGTPIFYELETQELEFGSRTHTKKISDKIVVMNNNGKNSNFSIKADDNDYKVLNKTLEKRINKAEDVNVEGNYFTFKWSGNTSGTSPVFEGFEVPEITDQGIV